MIQVASWWDYGYQTTAMAIRTVIVDNNTWNNTHIATVGRAMSSPERKAWQIYRSLDVEYVFVVFGGFIGYAPRSAIDNTHHVAGKDMCLVVLPCRTSGDSALCTRLSELKVCVLCVVFQF